MIRFTAYNKTLFFTKSESSILAIISTMPALVPGNYAIYNNVAGDQLAITFHAVGQPLTVEKLDSSDDQIVCGPPFLLSLCLFSHYYYRYLQWRIVDPGVHGLLAILPVKDTTVQACWDGDQSVTICPGLLHDWLIQEADNGYTYVTSTSWSHFPSSFPLVVSWMAVALLSGV